MVPAATTGPHRGRRDRRHQTATIAGNSRVSRFIFATEIRDAAVAACRERKKDIAYKNACAFVFDVLHAGAIDEVAALDSPRTMSLRFSRAPSRALPGLSGDHRTFRTRACW